MTDEETARLLREAVLMLRILALPQLRELRQTFEVEMLASEKRRKMWELMDGSRSLADIGRQVGTSGEAVGQFVAEVVKKWPDLIEVTKTGGTAQPRRLV